MKKVLNFFRVILLLAFMAFLVLCCHSCFMAGIPASDSGSNGPTGGLLSALSNNITLSAGSFSPETEELTAVVQPEDLPLLDQFTALRSADFSGSGCLSDIRAWAEAHPGVSVRYTVTLPDGQVVDNSVQSLDLSNMNSSDAWRAAGLLSWLPQVSSVELGTARSGNMISAEDLSAMQAALPNAEFHYSLDLLGTPVSLTDSELNLLSLSSEQVQEAASVLRNLSRLRLMHVNPALSYADLAVLHEAAPQAAFDYPFELWGVYGNLSDEYLSFSHITMDDEGAAVRTILPYMVNLRTLDMDTCNVSNESMASIRADFPSVDVIWRIWFAGYSVRTDVERILASSTARGGTVDDEEAAKLQYCNHVKYLDLGHNDIITDISFVYGMPDLEVLILAINNLSDITPLYGLTDLERLFICLRHHVPQDQIDEMQRRAPNCEINVDQDDPSLGAWRYANLTDRGWAHYLETGYFLFDNHPRYDLLREQFGYDNEEYAFYWLDPLY